MIVATPAAVDRDTPVIYDKNRRASEFFAKRDLIPCRPAIR
jgi:hypothetical protein